jgi:hypothetical protein
VKLADDLLYALDAVEFAQAMGFAADAWQVKALRSQAPRQIWVVTRQGGKSTTAGILGLHQAIYTPNSLVLLVSPTQRQSSELFKTMRAWLERAPWQPGLTEDNKLSCTFANGSRIVSLPGSEASIRGYTANLVIEDEAARVDDGTYYAIRPMLAVTGGRLLLMSTPFGRRGHFHEEFTNGGAAWERAEVPATACPRISPVFLEEERKALGDYWFSQEYLCQFRATNDTIFDWDLIHSAVSDEVRPLFTTATIGV